MGFSSSGGFTPDNITLDINASGQAEVKSGGVGTTQLGDGSVTSAKLSKGTWEKISDTTLGGSGNFDLTSIPSGYTVLKLICRLITSGSKNTIVQFNSATSGYTNSYIQGSGSSIYAGTNNGGETAGILIINNTDGTGEYEITINNNALLSKTLCSTGGQPGVATNIVAGAWSNTSDEINEIKIILSGGTFSANSRVVLLGLQ